MQLSACVNALCARSQAFSVFQRENINVLMMSQGASKTNISLVVDGARGVEAVQVSQRRHGHCPDASV